MARTLVLLVCILLTGLSIQAQFTPGQLIQNDTRSALGDCMERLVAAERELGTIKGERLRLLTSVGTLKTERNTLRVQRSSLQSDMSGLQDKLANSRAETEQLNSRIEVLQKQISELDENMSKLTSKNSLLESKLAAFSSQQNYPDSKISPALQTNLQVNTLINERKVVLDRLRTTEAEKERLAAEVERLTADKESVSRGTYDLEAKVAGLTSELSFCTKQLSAFPSRIASLDSQNAMLSRQVAAVQQEKQDLNQALEKLKIENSNLDNEVTKMKFEKSNIETEKITLQSYINKLQQSSSSGVDGLVKQLQAEVEALQSSKDVVAALQDDVRRLKNENSQLKDGRTMGGDHQEVARLRLENSELRRERAAMELEVQETLKEVTQLRLETAQSYGNSQNEVDELLSYKAALSDVELKNFDLKSKNHILESENLKLQATISNYTKDSEGVGSEYEIEILSLRADNDNLTRALAVADREVNDLRKDVAAANELTFKQLRQIEECEARDAELKARLDSQGEVINQIESEFNATREDIEKIREEKNNLQRDYAALLLDCSSKAVLEGQQQQIKENTEAPEEITTENVEISKDGENNSTKKSDDIDRETILPENSAAPETEGQRALQEEAERLAARIGELAEKRGDVQPA